MNDIDTDVRDFSRGNDFTDEVTQPLPDRMRLDSAPRLFARLADALDVSRSALELLLSELLVYVDATPETLDAEQVWAMRAGLFEVVENVLPASKRERSRSGLSLLLVEIAPLGRD